VSIQKRDFFLNRGVEENLPQPHNRYSEDKFSTHRRVLLKAVSEEALWHESSRQQKEFQLQTLALSVHFFLTKRSGKVKLADITEQIVDINNSVCFKWCCLRKPFFHSA